MRRIAALAALAAWGGVALCGASALAAEVRRIETVGAVPLDPKAPLTEPPRDAALRAALAEAVRQVALELLPDLDARESARVDEALGDDPLAYTTRYRIVEDRGERPALFSHAPGVRVEYVVVVETQVDPERIRRRLAARGLLVAPSGDARRYRLRVVIEDLTSYSAYASLRRTLLEDVGVRAALPVELERGRAVLAVDADQGADDLLAALLKKAPPELRITPLGTGRNTLTVRAQTVSTPGTASSVGERRGRGPAAIDTLDRNRY